MERTTDMTKGPILKLLLTFAFPLILTNWGQQLYMIADAAIVGRGIGVKALAAVGSADWIYWLILWSIMGLTQAFSTFVARSFGDKNFREMNKTIATSTILCIIIGSLLTVIGLLCSKPILLFLDTPGDIINESLIYLITMISGTLVVTAYNMASSVLRAFGDGKSPLAAMAIAALLNIGLDLLFVMTFKWGVFGAAFASVLSQFVSFIYCFNQIKKIDCVKLDKSAWKFDFSLIKKLLVFALPLSLQYILIALSGIILQSTLNLQGSIFVASFTAVNKLYGLLECTAISFGIAFSTFFAQNYGAGNNARVKEGVKTGLVLCEISAVIVMAFIFLFGKNLLHLFLDISKEGGVQAHEIAWKYLSYMNYFLLILYPVHVYRNVLQAFGISVWSMISGFTEFGARVFMGKAVVLWLGVDALFFVEPAAWIGALVFVMFPYYACRKKLLGNI